MKTKDRILIFISNYIQKNVIPPTVREIGKAVGLKSTSSVSEHLGRLKRDGYISYQPSIPRSIVMMDKGKQMAEFKRWQDEKSKQMESNLSETAEKTTRKGNERGSGQW